jgi:predicted 3-demethylubiquinone-9 3-methyltransferase (glyoxalase superfamily)
VRTIHFEINGQRFTGLNGGPQSKFNEAFSLEVHCEDQAEINYYWEKLGEGGDENKRKCGWINDKFGLWWQVLPNILKEYLGSDDSDAVDRVLLAMMGMKKYDIDELKRAFEGK